MHATPDNSRLANWFHTKRAAAAELDRLNRQCAELHGRAFEFAERLVAAEAQLQSTDQYGLSLEMEVVRLRQELELARTMG